MVKIKPEYIFPLLLILLDVGAAIIYAVQKDYKKAVYWIAAACMPIYEKGITGILGDNSSIADIINEQPTADVQEVKHGYWKSQKQSGFYRLADYECSICGYDNDETPDYCAFCGAKMEGFDD
jgi:hypothetical protein